MFIITNITR